MNDSKTEYGQLPTLTLNIKGAAAVFACPTPTLRALTEAGGIDPKRDFRGANLRGWPLTGQDVREFDFTKADLRDTGISEAVYDATTIFDRALYDEDFEPPLPPLPHDFLERAKKMILAGDTPPAHWVPNIKIFEFTDTTLTYIRPLATLTALRSLVLWNTQVSDINALASLTSLESLDLTSTKVGDISPLASLTSLEYLDLTRTHISDISALTTLAALKSLHLNGTQVSNIAALSAISGLTIWVESEGRAEALRATLVPGSKVEVSSLR